MSAEASFLQFDQLHIDIARNSTDDFNPFHDPRRWREILGNPFTGPIALGFQLEFLVADHIARQYRSQGVATLADDRELPYSNYEFTFAGALRPGERFTVGLKKTLDKTASGGGLATRAVVRKADGAPLLMGIQSETAAPRFLADADLTQLPLLEQLPDRIPVPGSPYFLKRKFMSTSNGKNFALAALTDPHDYFDELAERVHFPPVFTAALLSSALLEKAWREHYDFAANPMVYTAHQISVDRRLQRRLRSNDRLHLLVEGPLPETPAKGLGRTAIAQTLHRCFGLVQGQQVLFRANVRMAPLQAMRGIA